MFNFLKSNDRITPLLIYNNLGRGGTTLLMQLLGASPQIAFDRKYPFEVRYLTFLLKYSLLLSQDPGTNENWTTSENFKQPGNFIGPFPHSNSQFWDGKEYWKNVFKTVWKDFSNTIRNHPTSKGEKIKYYAEKVPYWLPTYLQQIVDFRIILLVRDPRDIFLSINAFDAKRGYSGFSRKPTDDDWSFAKRFVDIYNHRIKLLRSLEPEPNSILIKYEDMISNLPIQAKKLETWLKVQLNKNISNNTIIEYQHHMTSKTPYESIERWKRELSKPLNDFFIENLGEHLEYFEYEQV